MQVTFSADKQFLIFNHSSTQEYKAITKFPAFIKVGLSNGIPAVLPVAFNVISRCKRVFKNVSIAPEVQTWLDKPFRLREIPDSFRFLTEPKDFQHIALRFLYTLGSAGLLLDPGMGKSKVVCDYIALMNFKKSIIVCPAALLFVWEDEFLKHRSDVSFYVVRSTDWEKELPGIMAAQVTIINYNKEVILKHRLKEIPYEFMHLDEFLIKDPSTDRTKSSIELSRGIPYKCGGSGTLITNTPLDCFSPMKYLQPGLVGWNYTNFKDKYAVQVDSKDKSRKVIVGYRGQDEIRSMLDSCCIVMTKEKWLKLPEKKFHDIYVQMAPDQKDAYYQLMRNYYLEFQSREFMVDNPLVMLSKLYQISQGFLYWSEKIEDESDIIIDLLALETSKTPGKGKQKTKGKAPSREVLYFQQQPKIQALRELLAGHLKNTKCIIWFNLSAEYELISKLLDELGDEYLSIQGGDKKIGEKVRSFNKTPSIKRLVCQAKSVNYGITVMGSKREDLEDEGIVVLPDIDPSVCTEVFYSMSFSLEVYLQQIDRIHRLGQENVCNYYRIFANNPVERKIREAIFDKLTIKQDMLRDVATTLLSSESI